MQDRSVVGRFTYWYFQEVPMLWWRYWQNLGPFVVEWFGMDVHVSNLWVPMYQDRTLVGRGLSLAARLMYLLTGSLVWLLAMSLSALFLLVWWGFSLLLWVWSVGLWALWLLVVGASFYRRLQMDRPWAELADEYSWENVVDACPGWVRKLLEQYPNGMSGWWQEGEMAWWLARLGWWGKDLPDTGSVDKRVFGQTIWSMVRAQGYQHPSMGDVLVALVHSEPELQAILSNMGLSEADVQEVAMWYRRTQEWWGQYRLWDEEFVVGHLAGFNRAKTGVLTEHLNRFSTDLTGSASVLPKAIGREAVYEQVVGVLSKSTTERVMIVGQPGLGKTVFVGGLAQMIMAGNAPPAIADKRLVKLEPGKLVAGVRSQGELAGRLVKVMDEIKESENIILFIDEIHTLLTADESAGGLNVFSILEEALFKSQIQVIGTTSPENYKRYMEPNAAFVRMFTVVKLEEPNDADAMVILQNVCGTLEANRLVIVSLPAVKAAISLSRRYIHDRVLPNKAKDVLDEAVVRVMAANRYMVTAEDVAGVIASKTGVPVEALGSAEREKLLHLEEEIHKEYVNQDEAVTALANALRRSRLDVRSINRPIGAFMFVGPTGVGKTELARRLAEVYFGSEKAMIREDMSEYSNGEMISRLIGAPPGRQGFGQGGELTERVRNQSFSLLLLDEIEKAHPKVWDLLMQVIDAGRLTDASGLTVDFTNTIVITTSNAVTGFITDQVAKGRQVTEFMEEVFDQLRLTFRVEFLNRFDGIVPFVPLDKSHMEQIVTIEIGRLVEHLAEKKVDLFVTEELIGALATKATNSALGARPLRRLIQDKIESQIARVLLVEDTSQGRVRIELDERVLE